MDFPVRIEKQAVDGHSAPHTATPRMLGFISLLALSSLFSSSRCAEILYDGRAQPNFDASVLDNSSGPYLTYVILTTPVAFAKRFGAQCRWGIQSR